MKQINLEKFTPILWLSSLGAGGLAVSFFAFLNYTVPHGKGLINISHIHGAGENMLFYISLELLAAFFIFLHFYLSARLIPITLKWLKTDYYKEMLANPLANAALLAPLISLSMTMNVLIGPSRYFFPVLAENLQAMMLPGFIVWTILWVLLLRLEISLLKISFIKGFDLNNIHFAWLLHPFALGMLAVTGAGIAAMSQNSGLANIAAFMLLVPATMGLFLLLLKLVAIFTSQFSRSGLPDKQFLPSLLIVVPNITLYAITAFRFGHFLEHHHGAQLGSYYLIVMTAALAFETWYLLFGLVLLKDYFKKHMKKEFHASQWGLVCPFVAYAVLGSFVYHVFAPVAALYYLVLITITFTIFLFMFILYKQYLCHKLAQAKISSLESKVSCY